jgi:uncharacterized RDD family membrane protein YckC
MHFRHNHSFILSRFIASPLDRLSAVLVDAFVLTPIISLALAPLDRGLLLSQFSGSEEAAELWFVGKGFLVIAVVWLYHALFWWRRGATVGERFWGLRVQTHPERRDLSFATAASRAFWFLLCALPFGIPMLAIWSHPLRRTFYDRVTDTIVCPQAFSPWHPPTLREKQQAWGLRILAMALIFASVAGKTLIVDDNEETDAQCLLSNYQAEIGDQKIHRVDLALTLFEMGKVSRRCLRQVSESEVQHGLDLAQAALAVTSEPSLRTMYRERICKSPESKTACDVLTLIEDSEGRHRTTEGHAILKGVGPKDPLILRTVALKEAIRHDDLNSVQALVASLPEITALAELRYLSKLQMARMQGQLAKAQAMMNEALWSESLPQRAVWWAWMCRWEMESSEVMFCPKLHSLASKFPSALKSDEVAVTLWRWAQKKHELFPKSWGRLKSIHEAIVSQEWDHPLLESDWVAAERVAYQLRHNPHTETFVFAVEAWKQMRPFSEASKTTARRLGSRVSVSEKRLWAQALKSQKSMTPSLDRSQRAPASLED